MDLSIIIVNWKSVNYARNCIESIKSTVHGLEYEIIVVDSCSGDDCEGILLREYPDVRLLQLTENVGFARSNNAGARLSIGNFLLFLNPDTLVSEKAVIQLVESLHSSPKAGAAGARLLNSDGSVQLTSVQKFPTIINQLLSIGWLESKWPRWHLWGREALYDQEQANCEAIEVVSGACLLIRRSLFEEVDGFGEDYFMYAEESDLCEKIRRQGWTVLHVPDAEIVHFGAGSSKERGDAFSTVVMRESLFRLLKKYRGWPYATAYRAAMLASAIVRLAVLTPAASQPLNQRLKQSARHAMHRWSKIAMWSLGLDGATTRLGGPHED